MCIVLSALAFGQSDPYVTVTGVLQGPNGLPVSNNILSFAPTQNFFVAGNFPACNSYILQVNTTSLLTCGDTINFNSILPAAPANGINVLFQTSKTGTTDYISAALVGDGNAAHCLLGTGVFGNCTTISLTAGGGLVLSGSSLGLLTSCTNGQVLQWNGSAWLCATVGGGGGGGTPGGAPTQIQTQLNGTTFGAIVNQGPGYALVSEGTNTDPAFQLKPVYNVLDKGFVDDNSTDNTAAAVALINAIGSMEATIQWPISNPGVSAGIYRMAVVTFPKNITMDFSPGAAIWPITSTTPPGGGAFVQGTGVSNGQAGSQTFTSCSNSLSGVVAGHTLVWMGLPYPGYTYSFNTPADSQNDNFTQVQLSKPGQTQNSVMYVASNVAGGSVTVSATTTGLTSNSCILWELDGLGTIVGADPATASTNGGSTTSLFSGLATLLASDFAIGYGGQGYIANTCTAGGSYTLPAGTAGNTGGNQSFCAEYIPDASSGSQQATLTLGTAPSSWVFSMVGLRPVSATIKILGGIIDPDLHQLFYNATAGEGIIDLTGSNVLDKVYPEWWGASYSASPTTNCAAIQAAEHGAFGFGRTSVSGLSIWNRPLYFTSQYAINCTIQFYSVTGFKIEGANKEYSGITQTAANTRIIDAQSMSRGSIHDMFFQTTASQNVPLVDLDYNGVTTAGDLETYDISTYDLNFYGNGLGYVGMENAKSGGGAQGDNVRLTYDNFYGFTQCGYEIGQGVNGVPFEQAYNALQNTIIGGDYQANNMYGICIYGGSAVIKGTTFEDGFGTQSGSVGSQAVGNTIGFDIYNYGSQFPVTVEDVRSESRKLYSGYQANIKNSRTQEQSINPNPGGSQPVGTVMRGNVVTGDGGYYQVTIDAGNFGGLGTVSAPIGVSSATSTSLTNTNETVAGSVTQLTVVAGHTVIQTGTSSTATLVNTPTSIGTITGSLTSGTFVVGHTMTQSSSGVTATVENSPTGSASLTGNNFSGTALGTSGLTWTDSNGAIYTQTAGPTFSVSNPSMLITNPSGSPNGSGTWVDQTTGGVYTPTGAPVPVANWTTNAFLGMLVGIQSGTSEGCYGVVTSNSAQTINFTAGYVTKFDKLLCPTSDTTSAFVVEPNWNGGTIVDGGITLVALNEDGIGACYGCVGASINMDNVDVPGGKIHVDPIFSYLHNVTTTRPDWFNEGGNTAWDTQSSIARDWDVYLGDVTIVTTNGYFFQKYSQPGIGNGGGNVTASLQRNIGSELLVSTGGIGGSVPSMAPDSWIGGKSDPSCPNNDITCAPEEFGQSIGPPAAFGINQNGKPAIFVAGLSTGSGTPGNFDWYCGATGSSGTQVNSGGSSPSYCMTLGLNGLVLSSISAGTSPICPNGTGGALTTVGCSGGSGGGLSGMTTGQMPHRSHLNYGHLVDTFARHRCCNSDRGDHFGTSQHALR